MTKKTAAIIRGDGTGPELVEAMIKVLRACDMMVEKSRWHLKLCILVFTG
jgi:isocitrate/isopropylmalate dehydrogenase